MKSNKREKEREQNSLIFSPPTSGDDTRNRQIHVHGIGYGALPVTGPASLVPCKRVVFGKRPPRREPLKRSTRKERLNRISLIVSAERKGSPPVLWCISHRACLFSKNKHKKSHYCIRRADMTTMVKDSSYKLELSAAFDHG